MKSLSLSALALFTVSASARSKSEMFGWQSMWHLPSGRCEEGDTMGNSTFSQLIDHEQPELGTFEQFYYYDTTHWKGPGSPIVLFTPGEVNATAYTSYLTTNRTTGVIAERIGAATIVLEHRYWGTSTPYTNLTTDNMKYLTLANSISDLTRFAKEVKLPFAHHHASSNADAVPWVMSGGSYSGALSAWTASVEPGVYWAYHSSSAPVQAVSDYWGYFLPVQQGMPTNCSKDVSAVIDYMDDILTNGSEDEIYDLKCQFGLESVEHNDDFMAALENGPWLWQSNQFYRSGGFFEWCNYIENVFPIVNSSATGFNDTNGTNGTSTNSTETTTYPPNAVLPGPDGVGVEKALAGYARWSKEVFLPGYCESYGYDAFAGENNTACLDTYNANSPLYTDTSLSNQVDRQWVWMTCNEPFGYWQDGAPDGRPSIVSRLVTADYWIRQCGLYFPPSPDGATYGIAAGREEADVNAYTGGWNFTSADRLIYVNGDFDPWREASVSADAVLRPGGPFEGTERTPVNIVPGGFHTSDLVTQNGVVNEGAKRVIDATVDQIAEWVGEWRGGHHWHG